MESLEDLAALTARHRTSVREGIRQHLTHQPTRVSRSGIKLMRQPFWSQFRLRAGDYRVYYDVDEDVKSVTVLRVLFKGSEATPQEPP